MIDNTKLHKARIFVGQAGGELLFHDAEGEVIAEMGLAPGMHRGDKIAREIPTEWQISAGEGSTIIEPSAAKVVGMKTANAAQSGANPDYRPTNATTEMLRMQKMMRDINNASARLDRRMATLEASKAEVDAKAKAEADAAAAIEAAKAKEEAKRVAEAEKARLAAEAEAAANAAE